VQFRFPPVIAGGRDSDENVVLSGFQFPFKRARSCRTTLVVVFLPIDGVTTRIGIGWRQFESYPKGGANQNALQSQ
jgi:hypothetical protein